MAAPPGGHRLRVREEGRFGRSQDKEGQQRRSLDPARRPATRGGSQEVLEGEKERRAEKSGEERRRLTLGKSRTHKS